MFDGVRARWQAIRNLRGEGRELDDELQFHLDRLIAHYEQQGIPKAEAVRRARIELGGVAQIQEQVHDRRGINWLEHFLRDSRLALRNFRKAPGFALAAVFTLALGIGVNTALFTLLYSLAVRPLPISDPGSVRNIYMRLTGDGRRAGYGNSSAFQSFAEFQYLRSQARTAELAGVAEATMTARGLNVKSLSAQLVSDNLLTMTGAHPLLGRFFHPEETNRPGAQAVVVLSHKLWRTEFQSAEDIVGRTLIMNRTPFMILGVANQGFNGPLMDIPDLWIPVTMQAITRPGESLVDDADAGFIQTFARLRPGFTDSALQAEMTVLGPKSVAAHGSRLKARVFVTAASFLNFPEMDGPAKPILTVVSLAGLLVLLVACANVANLMLARGLSRRRELAIRLAIGAGKFRLIAQMVTEGLLLGLFGGIAGLLVAWQAGAVGLKMLPPEAGVLQLNLTPDPLILAFDFSISLLAAVGCSLLPACQSLRRDLTPSLKAEGLLDSRNGRSQWLQNSLVGVQVAVTVVLLVNAGLMIRGFRNAADLTRSRRMEHLLVGSFDLRQQQYTAERAQRFFERVSERLRANPNVEAVSVSLLRPEVAHNNTRAWPLSPGGEKGPERRLAFDEVGPDYFRAAGLNILAGRSFTAAEVSGGARVAVIDASFAEAAYQGQPLGRRFSIGPGAGNEYEIIGVVPSTPPLMPFRDSLPWFYAPLRGTRFMEAKLWIRRRGTVAAAEKELSAAAHAEDADVTVTPRRAPEDIALALTPVTVASWAASALGSLALMVAAIGLYGVMSFAVNSRLREMGVRVALGASGSDLLRLVFGQLPKSVGVGSLFGMAAAIGFAHLIRSMFYGVSPFDPAALISVLGMLAAVSFAASWIPARRAASVDPASVLRND